MAMVTDLRNISMLPRGQINKEWIYWQAHGERYRRPYVIPYDPKTLKQIEVRNKMRIIASWWNALTEGEKAGYVVLNKKTGISQTAYNYFFKLKFREVKIMVKQVLRGQIELNAGENVITIPEITLQKTLLIFNCFATGNFGVDDKQKGIIHCYISSATTLTAQAQLVIATSKPLLCWQLVEYV